MSSGASTGRSSVCVNSAAGCVKRKAWRPGRHGCGRSAPARKVTGSEVCDKIRAPDRVREWPDEAGTGGVERRLLLRPPSGRATSCRLDQGHLRERTRVDSRKERLLGCIDAPPAARVLRRGCGHATIARPREHLRNAVSVPPCSSTRPVTATPRSRGDPGSTHLGFATAPAAGGRSAARRRGGHHARALRFPSNNRSHPASTRRRRSTRESSLSISKLCAGAGLHGAYPPGRLLAHPDGVRSVHHVRLD